MRLDMSPGDLFAYLSAFVTIVLALAVGDMVQSTHRLIAARERVRWHPLPAVSAALVFLMLVSEFFSLAQIFDHRTISYFGVLGLLAVPLSASLAAFAALPDHVPDEGVDLLTFYDRNRAYLYGVLGLSLMADFGRTMIVLVAEHTPLLTFNTLRIGLISAGCIAVYAALIRWRTLWLQWLGLSALLALYMAGFAGWRIIAAG